MRYMSLPSLIIWGIAFVNIFTVISFSAWLGGVAGIQRLLLFIPALILLLRTSSSILSGRTWLYSGNSLKKTYRPSTALILAQLTLVFVFALFAKRYISWISLYVPRWDELSSYNSAAVAVCDTKTQLSAFRIDLFSNISLLFSVSLGIISNALGFKCTHYSLIYVYRASMLAVSLLIFVISVRRLSSAIIALPLFLMMSDVWGMHQIVQMHYDIPVVMFSTLLCLSVDDSYARFGKLAIADFWAIAALVIGNLKLLPVAASYLILTFLLSASRQSAMMAVNSFSTNLISGGLPTLKSVGYSLLELNHQIATFSTPVVVLIRKPLVFVVKAIYKYAMPLCVIFTVAIYYGTIYKHVGTPIAPIRSALFPSSLISADVIGATQKYYPPIGSNIDAIMQLVLAQPGGLMYNDMYPYWSILLKGLSIFSVLFCLVFVLISLFRSFVRSGAKSLAYRCMQSSKCSVRMTIPVYAWFSLLIIFFTYTLSGLQIRYYMPALVPSISAALLFWICSCSDRAQG